MIKPLTENLPKNLKIIFDASPIFNQFFANFFYSCHTKKKSDKPRKKLKRIGENTTQKIQK